MQVLKFLRAIFTGPIELLMEVLFSMGARAISETGLLILLISVFLGIPTIVLCHWTASARFCRDGKNTGWSGVFRNISLFHLPEILHFTAGRLFFNDLVVLHGIPFLMISDLGVPDSLIHISGVSLNILPVLVTAVHIASTVIQTRNFSAARKVQAWAVTILYLYRIYGSSAGFALYWLTYELLHLLTLVLFKGKPRNAVLSLAGLLCPFFAMCLLSTASLPGSPAFIMPSLILIVVLALVFLNKSGMVRLPRKATPGDGTVFLLSCFYLTILTGFQIPSMVIRSAPSDFINIAKYYSPFHYIGSALLIAAGTFIVWPGIAFLTAPVKARGLLAFLSAWTAVCGTINVMLFGNDRGIMSAQLVYDAEPAVSVKAVLINILLVLLTAFLLWLIRRKSPALLKVLVAALCVIKAVSAAVNCLSIAQDLTVSKKTIAEASREQAFQVSVSEENGERPLPEIRLSQKEKNVVVIMMDRSIGYFLPFLFAERPELSEQFDGFTFYPNTVSFGSKTNEAAPALFGGYEYTPERINERTEESLAEKHNQALRLMPVLFDEAGYRVTVIDPPYAGYQTIPDLNIYADHPGIKALHAENMLPLADDFHEAEVIMDRNRNFFCYSVYRVSPLFLQPALYSRGTYNKAAMLRSFDDMLTADRDMEGFHKAYNVLLSLPAMLAVDEGSGAFFIMDNRATHEPTLLQLPDYTLADQVDNTAYETLPAVRTSADGRTLELNDEVQETHYHVNMASFIALGSWLDHLREQNVYDNTRILIVSDHGHPMGYSQFKFGEKDFEDVLTFNPMFMVKDFNSHGFTVDETFMTNADTPTIAMKGLIADPVNPDTGQPVSDDDKFSRDILIKHTEIWDIKLNNGDDFLPGDWYRLLGHDIFDTKLWEYAGRH